MKKFPMRRLDLNNKKSISVILEFSILRRKIAKFWRILIFELNGAVNYSMVKKFHMRELDFNTERKLHLAILEILNFMWKNAKFRKIRIFEHNSALNYFMVKKFHMWKLDLNTKILFSAIFEFSNLKGENREILKNSDFRT